MNKILPRGYRIGYTFFLIIGIAFDVVGIFSGSLGNIVQIAFVSVGIVLIVSAIVFFSLSRRSLQKDRG